MVVLLVFSHSAGSYTHWANKIFPLTMTGRQPDSDARF